MTSTISHADYEAARRERSMRMLGSSLLGDALENVRGSSMRSLA